MAEGGALFNQDYLGESFVWWIGQVADDSYWRDNINPGKFKDKQAVRGWGYRYKVRIFGLHDIGEDSISSENLPWANVMYPITAGSYLQNSGQTPMIRQGNIVFGFFLDGSEQQQPVIMGCMGNNSQSVLATKIGDNRVSNTQNGTLATSGYSEGNVDYEGTSSPTPPDKDKGVEKPKDPELAKELADPAPGVSLNQFGLPINKSISKLQQKDINSARKEVELILEGNPAFSITAQQNLIKDRVAKGMAARKKEANSPRSPVQPGATIESEAVHVQSSADIKLDEVFCKKRVVLKPTSIVESCNKAMQTDMDNMTMSIDKAVNALSSYTDAVSMTEGVRNLKKVVSDSSKTQSKYMKVIMDKVMEYSQKKINKEMTAAVSALPACKRWQMLDLKDNMTQNMLSSFNKMSGGMDGMMEGILNNMLKVDGPEGLLNKVTDVAMSNLLRKVGDEKPKAMPRVPVCASEDAIAAVIASNKDNINKVNQNIIDGMDGFIGDMMKELAGAGGDVGGITNMLSKLGNIKGNMTSALNFIDGGQDVFPFEVPPNEAVSDYYTFCGGGAGQKQTSLPSNSAINAAINKVDRVIPSPASIEVFAEPFKNQSNIRLTDNPSFTQDEIDDAVADETEFKFQ